MVFTNSTLNLKHLAWVLLLLFFSCAQAEEYVPGRHYEILDNPTIYPNEETMKKLFIAEIANPRVDRMMTRQWIRIKTGR